jgi:hypothetical protein
MNGHNVKQYGFDNLLVASPTKLTLTPLLGDMVMDEIARSPHTSRRPAGVADLATSSTLTVSRERWTGAPLEQLNSLMDI